MWYTTIRRNHPGRERPEAVLLPAAGSKPTPTASTPVEAAGAVVGSGNARDRDRACSASSLEISV